MSKLPVAEDVAAAVNPMDTRGLLIIQLALVTGALMFLGVVVVLPPPTNAPEAEPLPLPIFALAHAFLTVGVWSAAVVVPRLNLRRAAGELRAHPPMDAAAAAAAWVGPWRASRILTLALLEGAALFGVAVLFLARFQGPLQEHPALFGHLAPLGVLVAYALGSLPTPEAFGRSWREHVLEGADPGRDA